MIRLALRVRREDAETVLAELLELAPSGVEESESPDGCVELAVYGAPGELPQLPDLRAAAGEAFVEVSTSEVADDWHDRWRSFHKAILIDAPDRSGLPSVHVRPPWLEPPARTGVCELVIDPGRAFGTGAHATTKLCLALLLAITAEDAQGRVLDLGTGSGVLAIAAAKLGFGPVEGFDNDRVSVAAARSNASANGVSATFSELDLRSDRLPPVDGAIVLSNLLRPLLLDLCARMRSAPEHLLISGLLAHEVDEVSGAFCERHGMRERSRLREGEWAAAWLRGPRR